jgi:hypothetical protein
MNTITGREHYPAPWGKIATAVKGSLPIRAGIMYHNGAFSAMVIGEAQLKIVYPLQQGKE